MGEGLKRARTAARATRTPLPVGYVKSPSGVYLIQDTRQYVGNCILWWCHEGKGYTTEFDKAGRFTEEQANTGRDTGLPIPVEAAEQALCTHVRAEALGRALDAMRVPS